MMEDGFALYKLADRPAGVVLRQRTPNEIP
jgi:hypothetical protein